MHFDSAAIGARGDAKSNAGDISQVDRRQGNVAAIGGVDDVETAAVGIAGDGSGYR